VARAGHADARAAAFYVVCAGLRSVRLRARGLVAKRRHRGPTKARTSIDSDVVSVLLRDTPLEGERSLVADGRAQLVLDMRKAFQMTMREELVAGIGGVDETRRHRWRNACSCRVR